MKSKVAEKSGQALLQAAQRLTPEERLNAFLEHCQLMMSLHQAGEQRLRPRAKST